MSQEVAVINNVSQEVAQTGGVNQNFNEFLKSQSNENLSTLINQDLENVQVGINTAFQYLDLEQGIPVRFVFMGIIPDYTCMSSDGVMITMPAVVLVDTNKDFYAYSATQAVGTFSDRNFLIGTRIELCWTKQKKTKSGGNMRVHTVKPLH